MSDPVLDLLIRNFDRAEIARTEQTAAIKELTLDLRVRDEAHARQHQEVLDEIRVLDMRYRMDRAEDRGRQATPAQPEPGVAEALHELAEAKKADAAERSWLREKAAKAVKRVWPKIEGPLIIVILQAIALASGYLTFKAAQWDSTPTPVEIAQPVITAPASASQPVLIAGPDGS